MNSQQVGSGFFNMSAGKGDKRRPQQISDEEMEKRWNKIFGKKKKKKNDKQNLLG